MSTFHLEFQETQFAYDFRLKSYANWRIGMMNFIKKNLLNQH